MKKHLLNGKWNMSCGGYSAVGNIPGSVYSFLYLDNEILPNPHYRDNEKIYEKLLENDFTFEKSFTFSKFLHPVHLVFEGLDTLCDVFLNGSFVASTDNMHF